MAIWNGPVPGQLLKLQRASTTVERACNNAVFSLDAGIDREDYLIAEASVAVVACLLLALGWPE